MRCSNDGQARLKQRLLQMRAREWYAANESCRTCLPEARMKQQTQDWYCDENTGPIALDVPTPQRPVSV